MVFETYEGCNKSHKKVWHGRKGAASDALAPTAGLRVGEIAGLRFDDVLETDGSVTDRVHINPAIAKSGVGRTVFVNKRLQRDFIIGTTTANLAAHWCGRHRGCECPSIRFAFTLLGPDPP